MPSVKTSRPAVEKAPSQHRVSCRSLLIHSCNRSADAAQRWRQGVPLQAASTCLMVDDPNPSAIRPEVHSTPLVHLIQHRNQILFFLYVEIAKDLAEQSICGMLTRSGLCERDLDAIFFVSVTGVAIPSIDARLMNRMNLRPDIKRNPIFGLGWSCGKDRPQPPPIEARTEALELLHRCSFGKHSFLRPWRQELD